MSHRHLLLAAASPLCFLAGFAHAETDITTAVTTPIATATAAGGAPAGRPRNSTGTVKPASGTAVTLNSNNNVNIDGVVAFSDVNNAVGVGVVGGATGQVTGLGSIQLTETYAATDTNGDGLLDGVFAKGSNRFGVQVTGAQPFHGSIVTTGGTITVQGNDSAGVSVETALDGQLQSGGTVTVTGDRSIGLHAKSTIGGNVTVQGGAVTATGAGAVGIALDDNVAGRLVINQTVIATGYRSTTRPADTVLAKITADEMQIGGSALRIQGDVAGGVLIAAPPATLDSSIPDVNKDGIADTGEVASSVLSFGSAPALIAGANGRAVHFGALTSGLPYGLAVMGTVQGTGVYDGVAATGIQLGGLGGAVTVDGGIYVGGTVAADAAKANSTALRLGSGTVAHTLANVGVIRATATSAAASSPVVNVRALEIDAGAQSRVLFNSGSIVAAITGATGQATAVQDSAGQLTGISNTGLISATIATTDLSTATGSRIALDLRANTGGVTLTQSLSGVAGSTPAIVGDVLFGTGSAHLNLLAGSLTGAVAFGGGTNSLVLDGGATMAGALTKTGGTLSLDVTKGSLTVTNAGVTSLTSLNVGAASTLVMTIDPANGGSTQFDVAGAATIASGAKIGLRFGTKLSDPASFTLIKAGTLNAGAIDQTLLGTVPYLYQASLRVDTTQNTVFTDVRRRTSTELGLNAAEASAYNAIFANFDSDPAVRDALLGKTDQASFDKLYDQLMPDNSGGLFQVLSAANGASTRALDQGAGRLPKDGYRAWTQEIAVLVSRDLDRSSKYDAGGFGLSGGVETPETRLGILGLQTSFVSVDVDEKVRASASNLNGSVLAAGLYWRANGEGIIANVSATGGYAWLSELRAVTDTSSSLSRSAKSSWSGLTGAIHADVGYRFDMGAFYAKPQLSADYFVLQEDSRDEHGGGTAVDLSLGKRTSQELDGFAGVTVGARFGDAFSWSPELTAGYKAIGGDGAGDTKGHFLAGGPSFDIATPKLSGGGGVIRAALRGQGEYFDVVVEGGGEFHDNYQAYDARVTARWVF
jgi:hypothetical protein